MDNEQQEMIPEQDIVVYPASFRQRNSGLTSEQTYIATVTRIYPVQPNSIQWEFSFKDDNKLHRLRTVSGRKVGVHTKIFQILKAATGLSHEELLKKREGISLRDTCLGKRILIRIRWRLSGLWRNDKPPQGFWAIESYEHVESAEAD